MGCMKIVPILSTGQKKKQFLKDEYEYELNKHDLIENKLQNIPSVCILLNCLSSQFNKVLNIFCNSVIKTTFSNFFKVLFGF